jgi:hypothetical protein
MSALILRGDACARPGCTDAAGPRGFCESDYRRKIRMRLFGYRDAGPARVHVAALRDLGWTYEQIAEAAQVSTYVPHKIATGRTQRLWPESEQALLAIPLKARDSHRGINSAGTRRRVQALAWMGWPATEVAARAGTTPATLRTLILPSRQISFALARRVAEVYERLSLTSGPSKGSASKARQLGFAPPMAWDDDRIDNPRARPRGMRVDEDGAAA